MCNFNKCFKWRERISVLGTYTNATKAEGSTQAKDADSSKCVVSNPTDIYPVEFYDQTIVPASAAARAVLYGK